MAGSVEAWPRGDALQEAVAALRETWVTDTGAPRWDTLNALAQSLSEPDRQSQGGPESGPQNSSPSSPSYGEARLLTRSSRYRVSQRRCLACAHRCFVVSCSRRRAELYGGFWWTWTSDSCSWA